MKERASTIHVSREVRQVLESFKLDKHETVNDVLERILIDDGKLSKETRDDIEMSLREFRAGKFKTHEEVGRQLGLTKTRSRTRRDR